MIANNNTWSVKVPSSIKAGNYVLRHETIALHQAQGVGGAQLYPQCANLIITGGGSDTSDGVLGTELYKWNDPGILFNIYQTFTSTAAYTVPGPALYSGAVTGSAAPMATAPTVPTGSSSGGTANAAPGIQTTSGDSDGSTASETGKPSPGEEIGETMDNSQGREYHYARNVWRK